VRNADGVTRTQPVTVTVPTVPVFYVEGRSGQFAVGVVRSDGSDRRLVSCPIVDPQAQNGVRFAGLYGLRTFEPPDGGPVRSVFLEIAPAPSGGVQEFRLWSGDEQSGCSTQPAVRIDSNGFYNDHAHFWPRFSPDGRRVLYVDKPQDMQAYTYRVVTTGVDGRLVFIPRSGMIKLHDTPPVWIDDTHLAWVENVSTTATPHLVVYGAEDGNASSMQTLLDCDGVLGVINQIEWVNGAFLVAGATGTTLNTANPPPIEIYRMAPGACSRAQTLAAQPPGGVAWDFAVSPDGQTMIYSATDGNKTRDLYRVPTDGSAAPIKFAGDPDFDEVGPRFVAGGRQVVWTQATDMLPSTGSGVMIANADGTHARSLYAQGNGASVSAGSNLGTACSYGDRGSPCAAGVALLLTLMAFRTRWPGRPGGRRRTTGTRTR
jgi:hypothetical protein